MYFLFYILEYTMYIPEYKSINIKHFLLYNKSDKGKF